MLFGAMGPERYARAIRPLVRFLIVVSIIMMVLVIVF